MITFKPLSNPLMICGDNPALPGGLSRSGRDIATLAATLPAFRVGYLGRGISQNRRLPFLLYDYPESGQWGENYLPSAWTDFSGGTYGALLTTDDLSRRHWLVNPQGLSEGAQEFLGSGRNFQRWAYVPLDSTGPDGLHLATAAIDCATRFDRILVSSEWGFNVMRKSVANVDWLPHGIWVDKFHPYPNAKALADWEGKIVVGMVASNQERKDYAAAFHCFARLKAHYGNRFKAWLHTDTMIRYWNVYALATDYNIGDSLEVTQDLNDDQLAVRYSACDCTILPTGGEGFGFPIAESMACGTPCVTTNYAGGAELVPEECRVAPMACHVATQHNVLRAINSGPAFANIVMGQIEYKQSDPEYVSAVMADRVSYLDWTKLRHLWERWLLAGLK